MSVIKLHFSTNRDQNMGFLSKKGNTKKSEWTARHREATVATAIEAPVVTSDEASIVTLDEATIAVM